MPTSSNPLRVRPDASTRAVPKPERRTLWQMIVGRSRPEDIHEIEVGNPDPTKTVLAVVDTGDEPRAGDIVVVNDGESPLPVECVYHPSVPIPPDVGLVGVQLARVTIHRRPGF